MLPDGFTLLQVVPALDAGGVERTTVDVSNAVVAAGGRSLVASAGGRLEGELKAGGGELVRLPLDTRDPLRLWWNSRRLRRLIGERGPSVVHARSRAPAWSARWALGKGRGKGEARPAFVTTYAGIHSGGWAGKRWYNSVMASGDLVIANSDFTRRHVLAEHGTLPERVVAIPRGIDLSRFDPDAVTPYRVLKAREAFGLEPDDDRLVLLLAGRLTRWKGQAFILDPFADALKRGLHAVLVLAGDDQGREAYRREVLDRIADLKIADQAVIAGHVDDMAAAYAACDLALAPSLEPEAFGRTAVEPQAMERPVLVSDHGAPPEAVADGAGWRVPPGDEAAWTDALLAAAALDPFERRRMGRAGRAFVAERFGLQAMTDATLAAYAELLRARAR